MLSAIILTRNEASSIERCIASLSFADEVIVVDSGSTDQTTLLAKRCGANVFTHAWAGYGEQKNFGAAKAMGQWLLFIDADEELSPALAKTITSLINTPAAKPPYDYYWLRIITIFLHRPLTHLEGNNLRLFKKSAGHWNDATVHEQVVSDSNQTIKLGDPLSGRLSSPLFHYSHRTISSYLKKMHYYTTLDAKQMYTTGHHRSGRSYQPSTLLPYRLFLRQLVKLLFYRRGFLDGIAGCTWCFLSAYYEYEMGKKYLRLNRIEPQIPFNPSSPDKPLS